MNAENYFTFLVIICLSSHPMLFAEEMPDDLLSKDRMYLEFDCDHPGMQEMLLKKDGSFEITSFNLESKERIDELDGQWQLKSNLLILDYTGKTIEFSIESSARELLGKKFLMVAFSPVKSDEQLPFTACKYVDKRIVEELTGID